MQFKDILIESHYFPCISFFALALLSERLLLESFEHYQKSSYRNRCHLSGPNGMLRLSVPLKKGKNSQTPLNEVLISYEEAWISNHLHAIRSCYGNAPYFIHYYDEIAELLVQKYDYLNELNVSIIKWITDVLDLDIKIDHSVKYRKQALDMFDARNQITPKTNLSAFKVINKDYPQVFSTKFSFIQNLSILDLLFNLGPEASLYLKSIIHE